MSIVPPFTIGISRIYAVRYLADVFRYRDLIIPDFPTSLITIKFIVGLPPLSSNPILSTPPSQVFLSIRAEQEKYGDMIILPVSIISQPNHQR